MIRLDPTRIDGDAADVGAASASLIRAWNALHGSLSGTAGMAGDDEGAEQWGLAYDKVVPEMDDTIESVSDVLNGFEALLAMTARTYNNVELYGAGYGDNASGIDVPNKPAAAFGEIPKCIGAGAEGWLGEMQEVLEGALAGVGVTFPRGDTGKLRTASSHWLTFTQDLNGVRNQLTGALGGVAGSQLPHSGTINRAANEIDSILKDVALGCIGMSSELNNIAHQIDATWHELQTMAIQLAIEIAIEIGISIALSFVTFGGAAAAGAVVVATRVAHWAYEAAMVIRRLASLLRIAGSKLDDFYRILNKFQTGGFFWRAGFQAGSSSIASIGASFAADGIMGNKISGEQAWAYVLGGLAGGVAGGAAGVGLSLFTKLPNNVAIAMGGGAVEGMAEGVAAGLVQAGLLNTEFNLGQALITGAAGGAAVGGIGHGVESIHGNGGGGGGGTGGSGSSGGTVDVDITVPDTNVTLDLDTGGSPAGTPDLSGGGTGAPHGGSATVGTTGTPDIGSIDIGSVTSTTTLDGLPDATTEVVVSSNSDGDSTSSTITEDSSVAETTDSTEAVDEGVVGDDAGDSPVPTDTGSTEGTSNEIDGSEPLTDQYNPMPQLQDGVISADELAARIQAIHDSGGAMSFFGEPTYATHYESGATLLGSPGSTFFGMPLGDGMQVDSPLEALRQTGYAYSVADEFLTRDPVTGAQSPRLDANGEYHQGHVYAIIYSLEDITTRPPVLGEGSEHWLDGGHTAVLTEGPPGQTGLLINATEEFVFDGGTPVRPGSIVVEILSDGWRAVRLY